MEVMTQMSYRYLFEMEMKGNVLGIYLISMTPNMFCHFKKSKDKLTIVQIVHEKGFSDFCSVLPPLAQQFINI